MTLTWLRRAVQVAVAITVSGRATGQATYHVDGACGNDEWAGLSEVCEAPDGPKRTIGAATGIAGPGDTVLVAPGTYPLNTNGFGLYSPITVRASGGPLVSVLDGEYGSHNISVYNFGGGPGVIEGFTLTRVDTFHTGPIFVAYADLTLIDCRFIENRGFWSGGVWMDDGNNIVTAINCAFHDNSGQGVGVIFAWALDLVNCTFVGNEAPEGGTSCVYADEDMSISNSIFRGTPPFICGDGSVTYCSIQGGYPGEGNIDADPMFVDAGAGDLRLLPGSPCIDAGDNSAVPEWLRLDIGGLERFVDDPATKDTGKGVAPIVDMGAHEFQVLCYPDLDGDGTLDLFDFLAFVNLFNAGDDAADCSPDGIFDLFDFLCFVNAFNAGCG
jgi:hypothetical protein